MTPEQIERVEKMVNDAIAADMPVVKQTKSLDEAKKEGAMALFGEKYGEIVRTISIVESGSHVPQSGMLPSNASKLAESIKYSYELCGGTHLERTSDIGSFLILNEGSAAAGIRRIEAATGRGAYELISKRFKMLKHTASILKSSVDELPLKVESLQDEISNLKKELANLSMQQVSKIFDDIMKKDVKEIGGIHVLAAELPGADMDTLRLMADKFKQQYTGGTIVLGSVVDNKPILISGSYVDPKYYTAVDVVKVAAEPLGGSGGGRPNLAQAGGKYPEKLGEAIDKVRDWIKSRLEEKVK
jgi:alanyl-tRNA synthetase